MIVFTYDHEYSKKFTEFLKLSAKNIRKCDTSTHQEILGFNSLIANLSIKLVALLRFVRVNNRKSLGH